MFAWRFSGYDGSILCLAENGGDVAFTKVIYVRKYFGVSWSPFRVDKLYELNFKLQLPIGHATKSLTEAQADPNDFEYLCEDGSKVPITGKACTWAQRPWQAYMGNGDINQKVEEIVWSLIELYLIDFLLQQLERLQRRLSIFYEDAKSADHQNVS